MDKNVVLCEPCKVGFDQAKFTAALIQSVLLAWPDARASFLAEQEHLQWVFRELARHSPSSAGRIDGQSLEVPPKNSSLRQRGMLEARACSVALKLVEDRVAEALIFCSTTTTLLIALKSMLLLHRRRTPVLIVPHDILNPLAPACARGSWRQCAALLAAFRLPHPANLRYLALGELVREEIGKVLPGARTTFCTVDLPYFLADAEPANTLHAGDVLRIGFFGGGMKGLPAFARLAEEVQRQEPGRCEFLMVGFLNRKLGPDDVASVERWVQGVSCEPLSVEEYGRRASSLTYAVWTAEPESYRLRMSATFLDAMAHAKPVIARRTPWLEYYFKRMGDIGYLCDDLDGVKETVLSIVRAFPRERYAQQCRNIVRGRSIFSPEVVGRRVREAIELMGA